MRQKATIASSLIVLFVVTSLITTVKVAASVTWSEQLGELPTYEFFDGYPSVTQLANGTIYVVWSREVKGIPKIFYMTSQDRGQTWSEEMNLTDKYDEYKDIKPSITQITNGTIWVVWSSNRPPPAPPPEPDFSIDASPKDLTIPQGGSDNSTIIITSLRNFSEPVNLSVIMKPDNVTTTLNPDHVTPPPNGTAYSNLTITVEPTATPGNYTLVVMGEGGRKKHFVDLALEITESSALGHESTSSPISQDDPGSLEKDSLYYKTSNDGGTTWSNASQLEPTSTSNDRSPSIIQDMNGTLWIAWGSDRGGNQEIFYKISSDGESSWSEAHFLTTHPDPDRSPSITQTMDGRIWVTWSSYRTGYSEIFYKTYNGTSWSNATQLTNSTDIDTSSSILQTFDGTIWVFWSSCEDQINAEADIFYKYSYDNGASWSDRIQFTTDANEDTWPSTTQTRDSKIWVVWTTNRTDNYDLFYRTSLVGDITGPEDPPGSGEYPPDGTVDTCDLAFVCNAYGDKEGDPDWNESKIADITGRENPPASRRFPPDGVIDIYDLAIVSKNYGTS